jgi:hypothetical protein
MKGGRALNPDLTVRGYQPYSRAPYRAEIATPELLEKARRCERLAMLVNFTDWSECTNEELDYVYSVAKQAKIRARDRKMREDGEPCH